MPNTPSGKACKITNEILDLLGDTCRSPELRQRIQNSIRGLVRETIEHCAQVAEDYVANEDLKQEMSGMQVGDAIAAELRNMADERRLSRVT